jgi:hypothetical protein
MMIRCMRPKPLHLWILALVALVICQTQAAASQSGDAAIGKFATERTDPGEQQPPNALLQFVLGRLQTDDIQQLNECIEDAELKKGDYAPLFRAVKFKADGGRIEWFLRPARNPYCDALYGAHLFRYFWIEELRDDAQPRFRLLFENGGDFFTVYAHKSHGLHDIEATGCTASECRSARMSFTGRLYKPAACYCEVPGDDNSFHRFKRKCGTDFRDDQSSGFARSCRK